MKYIATQLTQYSIITLDNVKCTDREIQTKNEFSYLAEAQQLCDELNSFTTIITSKEALDNLEVKV